MFHSPGKDMKIGILLFEKGLKTTIKILDFNRFEMKGVVPKLDHNNEYFYSYGDFYFLAWKNINNLCLYTWNKYDQLVPIICNLSSYDSRTGKCSFVLNPHMYGLIYVNLKSHGKRARTQISYDNGKTFVPVTYHGSEFWCLEYSCGVEYNLGCSASDIRNHFPEPWIVKFKGTIH
ncbi:hypothetical protein RF11_05197 [Thelohanellus kitauei]|uniref:Uncharacterized protein n=1 Tax=Thelohanellus kitauei TaxID=669202 RepID=A0A0C2J0I2_THEKT|nr:hypothetical protein RF11_05197 [Thelohanellus kitauei]